MRNGHLTDGQIHFVCCIKIYKYKLTLTGPEAKVQFKLYTSKKWSPRVSTSVHLLWGKKSSIDWRKVVSKPGKYMIPTRFQLTWFNMAYPGETMPSLCYHLYPMTYHLWGARTKGLKTSDLLRKGHLVLTSHSHVLHHGFISESRLLSHWYCTGSQRKMECWYSPKVLEIEDWQN